MTVLTVDFQLNVAVVPWAEASLLAVVVVKLVYAAIHAALCIVVLVVAT